jgi:hypothetical protein
MIERRTVYLVDGIPFSGADRNNYNVNIKLDGFDLSSNSR